MVLTSEELGIAQGIMHSIQNTSTYGYEVSVKGTVVDGIACLICGLITIIASYVVVKKLYEWAKKENEIKPKWDKGFPYLVALFGIMVAIIAIAIICNTTIYDPFMKIFAPEYTVIKQILEIAAKTAT